MVKNMKNTGRLNVATLAVTILITDQEAPWLGGGPTHQTRVCFIAVAIGLAVLTPAAQQTTFRSDLRMVAIYASVSDRAGRLVPHLTKADFQVIDDGRPVEITLFSSQPQPATIAILLDMSTSVVTKVMRVREATQQFVEALLPGDRARIGTFGDEIAISPLLTGDKKELTRILHEELWPGGGTPLWNAMYAAMTSLAGEAGRRVILSLTDGDDSVSLPGWSGTLGDVERKAIDESFMVYAIGMEGGGLDRRVIGVAVQTGGGHFQVKRDADLAATFSHVADELRHQYLLGFTVGALDGRLHTLDVQLTRPGLRARARKSYLAASGR